MLRLSICLTSQSIAHRGGSVRRRVSVMGHYHKPVVELIIVHFVKGVRDSVVG
jgi:hypothetical protein